MTTLNVYSMKNEDPYYPCFIDVSNKFIQQGAGWRNIYRAIENLDAKEEAAYDEWIKGRIFLLPAEFLDQETPEQYRRNE